MPTRFYTPGSSYPAPITPAYSADWERTTNAQRRSLSTTKLSSASNSYVEDYESSSSQPYDVLLLQYVSDPLAAQTLSGYVKGQFRCYEGNAAADYCRAIVIKVVSNDGSTVRGTLLSHFPSSLESEFATTVTNRYFPPSTAINSLEVQNGDRIVVELGFRSFNTTTSGYYGRIYINDTNSTDLPEDESTTTDYASWIEFSANIDFIDQLNVSQATVQVEYDVPPNLQAHQVIVQVEYEPTPEGQFTTTVEVTASFTPSAETHPVFTFDAPATVSLTPTADTLMQGAGEFVTDATVTVALTPTPVTIWVRVGTAAVMLSIGPEAETSCPVRVVTVEATVSLTPSVVVRIPVIGWDEETGYGLLNLSWLSETPPFYVVYGDIPLVVSPSADSIELCAIDEYVINPAIRAGGRASVTHAKPDEWAVDAEGGPTVGGEPAVEFPEISIFEHPATGGLTVGGACRVEHFLPTDLTYVWETRGGARISGLASPQLTSPADLLTEYAATGGVRVGPVRVPAVEWVYPAFDLDVYEVTVPVELAVGGESEAEFSEGPETYEQETKRGVRVSGACGVAWVFPEIYEWECRGGVVLSGLGVEEEELFYTYVLTGFSYEPSIYSGFRFNSYAAQNGRALAAADDGVYVVLEGDDDDGRPIHSGVALGPTSFGYDNYKRLRRLHLGDCGEAQVRIAGLTRGQEGYYSRNRGNYTPGRNLMDKIHTIEIEDFTSLSQMEIELLVMEER